MKKILQAKTRRPVATSQRARTSPKQIKNDAGGYVWESTLEQKLHRFLIMGSPSDYYADEKTRSLQSLDSILKALEVNPVGTIRYAAEISTSKPSRAVSNDPAVFIISVALKIGDLSAKEEALRVYNDVVRTGTDLLHSVMVMKNQRGNCRHANRAVQEWLRQPNAYFQVAKYFNRDGMTFRDVLRLVHPSPLSREQDAIFSWIAHNGDLDAMTHRDEKWTPENRARVSHANKMRDLIIDAPSKSLSFLKVVSLLKGETNPDVVADAIEQYKLPWEVIPTNLRNEVPVAMKMLNNMPPNALLRQLGRFTASGLFSYRTALELAVSKLTNKELLVEGRVHPLRVLQAMMVYSQGMGERGGKTWKVLPEIVDALEDAFDKSFASYTPHNKKILFGIDVSGSMRSNDAIGMQGVSAAQAAVAFGMMMARREPNARIVPFTDRIVSEIVLSKRASIVDLATRICNRMEGTDCAQPIQLALREKAQYDAIVLLTDMQTWSGGQHVHEAIKEYRRKISPKCRFFAAAMASNQCTLADPDDPLSMNGVGFDTSAPDIVREFVLGNM